MPDTMVERVGEALRNECLAVFGSTWSNDVAWRFARTAIKAMREPTEAMKGATYMRDWEALEIWQAMVDAALKEQEGHV